MDSVSQFALGAACGIAVMGRRTAVWKAALWGGVCGTLPDLDAFFDHGDPVSNVTLHRANSHAVVYLTAASPLIAWLISRIHRGDGGLRRWWLAVWLALVTHPLLDTMTVYGTQILRPFTDHPYGVGSIFIIDPLYTLPLLAGVIGALSARGTHRAAWNSAGLALSTAYLAWGFAAQQHVERIALRSIEDQGMRVERLLVTPTPFNTLLWRVLAMSPDGDYHEGFHSLLDAGPHIRFDRFDGGRALLPAVQGAPAVQRIAWFSKGFFKLAREGSSVTMSDLRMGQEPVYTFTFWVAEVGATGLQAVRPTLEMRRVPLREGLAWLWPRMLGDPVPPPRQALAR